MSARILKSKSPAFPCPQVSVAKYALDMLRQFNPKKAILVS